MVKQPQEIRWFHSIDLCNGLITSGIKPHDLLREESEYVFRYSPAGMSVLDVGAWDGFFSFEAERRDAVRVLATDHFCWSGPGWETKDGFDTARHFLGSRGEDLDIDVLDISPETTGTFDMVLFSGVLYHLKNPFLGLEKVCSVCSRHIVVETLIDLWDLDRPAGAFYPGRSKLNDPTNWWGLNHHAVSAMLNELGFPRVEIVLHPRANPQTPDSMRAFFYGFREVSS